MINVYTSALVYVHALFLLLIHTISLYPLYIHNAQTQKTPDLSMMHL